MKLLEVSELKQLMLDITSRCNLVCPQCSRVKSGQPNPLLPLMELKPEDYDKIFTKKILSQLEKVILNGNFGEPISSKYIDLLIGRLLNEQIKLEIFTNGSLRNLKWWKSLGSTSNTKYCL